MTHTNRRISIAVCIAVLVIATLNVRAVMAAGADAIKRGEYIFNSAGCIGCHTDVKNQGAALAGGRALETPFGTYFGPNITPDKQHGIGSWTDAQFIRALREGISPEGDHYFPVFPYTSFTKMTDQDMKDLKAYIFTIKPIARPNTPHDVSFPFSLRLPMLGWKLLFFDKGEFRPDPSRSAQVNRGAYLAEALAHCGECHTPRNLAGGLKSSLHYAGTVDGPEGDVVPNITPDEKTGIGKWTGDELIKFLKTGVFPWDDDVSGSMEEVISNGTSQMTEADRAAIAAYLGTLPAIENKLKTKK